MAERDNGPRAQSSEGSAGSDDVGTLSVEDDPTGTVDPADLAGSAGPRDDDAGYRPASTVADPEPS
jgi:hypothetical protein